jgi:preprotein translocase subunit SecE
MLGVRVPPGLPAGAERLRSLAMNYFEKARDSFKNLIDFLKDTRKELNNVSWPGRREVTGTTVVVIATVFFFGFFLFIVDIVVGKGMNLIDSALVSR